MTSGKWNEGLSDAQNLTTIEEPVKESRREVLATRRAWRMNQSGAMHWSGRNSTQCLVNTSLKSHVEAIFYLRGTKRARYLINLSDWHILTCILALTQAHVVEADLELHRHQLAKYLSFTLWRPRGPYFPLSHY
jgi:hypothetical protein